MDTNASDQPENGVDASIAALIDHTILRPEATGADIRRVCAEARMYGFASVCANPYWAALVASELTGSPVKVCIVIGFPLGANTTATKVAEAEDAIRAGAQEIDMVLNIGELCAGNHDAVTHDIRAVVEAAHAARPRPAAVLSVAVLPVIVKVILETALLDDRQKLAACRLSKLAGAEFVKTSTGFGPRGATVEDVALLRRAVGAEMGVKASGGIRTLDDLKKMISAGANRIGTSAGVKIVEATGA